MITLATSTAAAIALHSPPDGLWAMFLQVSIPSDHFGPIKIDCAEGAILSERLLEAQRNSAYEIKLIGLAPIEGFEEVDILMGTFAACHMHDAWFEPCGELIALIAERAQDAITALLAQTHPGGLDDTPTDVEGIAQVLGVSTKTIRRLVKANQIPYLKLGRSYRFVVADVLASLERRER